MARQPHRARALLPSVFALLASAMLLISSASVTANHGGPHVNPDIFQLPQDRVFEIIEPPVIVIAEPVDGQTYVGQVPLQLQLVSGPAPDRISLNFERRQHGVWSQLGMLHVGWNLVPATVPQNFVSSPGKYRLRFSYAENERRRVSEDKTVWSEWRGFRLQ